MLLLENIGLSVWQPTFFLSKYLVHLYFYNKIITVCYLLIMPRKWLTDNVIKLVTDEQMTLS